MLRRLRAALATALTVISLSSILAAPGLRADDTDPLDRPLLRISTENTPEHVQTRVVAAFARDLQERFGDRLKVVHEPAARLFRDRDVVHALRQGQVEMAVPGMWQLDRLVPPSRAFLLPAFYGLDAPTNHALRDGAVGAAINGAIERQLDVVVPGRWIDLGFTHIYTLRTPVRTHDDLAGLVIRIAGGEANAARLRALGMGPVVVPWPDLPAALAGGGLDGVMTSHETVASARLWESGLSHVFEDRQYFAQYVPLVAARFWNRLPADLQSGIRATWEAHVEDARAAAAAAQDTARATLIAQGLHIVTPDDATLRARRREIAATSAAELTALGLDPALVADILATLGLATLERAP